MTYLSTFLVILVLGIGVEWLVVSNASESRAKQAVENLGWKNVVVHSKRFVLGSFGGCTQSDNVIFHVSGYSNGILRWTKVCASLPLGGYTVRY